MRNALFIDSSPLTQVVILAFIMLVSLLLFMFIGILFAPLIIGFPFNELADYLNAGDTEHSLKLTRFLLVLQHIGLFILPAFFAAYLFSGNIVGYFGFVLPKQNSNPQSLHQIHLFGATLVLIMTVIPFINLLASLNESIVLPESLSSVEQWMKNFEESARQTTKMLLKVDSVGGVLFNVFLIAMLPAIGEELIFRGVLHNIFVKWVSNIHVAVLITGFLFSAMHFQFYGFFPRWLLGVIFGYMFVWSGTIWLPIFAHFVNNLIAVLIYYFIYKGTVPEDMDVFGANWTDIPVTVITTVISAIMLWFIYRNRKDRKIVRP